MAVVFAPLIKIYKVLYLYAYDITCNYGISLILLSLFTFIILYPFNKKAQQIQNKEHKIQSILSPQIDVIKNNYNGQEQYEQLQWLYRRYGYHPLYAIRLALGFIFQVPFLTAAYYMLSDLAEIQGVSWGIIPNLGVSDRLLVGVNLLPFVMTLVTCIYAFIMPEISKKERFQTVIIGFFFLLLLYNAPSALIIFWTCNLIWSLLGSVLCKKLDWIGDYIAENELAFHIIFALALTVGLLVPLEVYINNASQLWFSIKDILKYFLTDTVKYFVFLLFVYVAFWVKKIRSFYLSILLGMLFGVFLQSYVIGIDYGLFDGHEIAWEKYAKEGLLNTFIWLFCLGETFVVFKRFKFDLEKLKKYVKPVTFGIVVIQCIALMFALKNNPLPDNAFRSKDYINVLTTKDMFTISSKDNIIVFLLDAFDARIFEEIMVKDPDIIKELDGFTFYPDTTSVYGYTDYSLPQILTGKIYLNDRPYVDYFEEAWKETPYYNDLLNKNYDVCIYTAGNLVSKTAPISNLVSEKTVLNDESMRSFNNLVRFRMVPHYIKKAFYDYNPNDWMSLLVNSNVQAYQENDRLFYIYLKKGLKYQNDKNSFRFYHLTGAHFPFILDRNLEPVGDKTKGSQYEQSEGAMKIVIEYIRQMKEKNVFGNSTFVIMADHGDHNKIGSRPLLCIKKPKDEFVMKVSADAISFSEFFPMMFTPLKVVNTKQKNHFLKQRSFYFVEDERGFIEYNIIGNAKEKDSWQQGRILKYERKENNTYVLGKTIDFTMDGNSKEFKGNGWSQREEKLGTWTIGSNADLNFTIKDYQKQNLKISFVAAAYLADLKSRKAKIFVNQSLIAEILFDNKCLIHSLKVPSSEISSDVLNLHFEIDHPGVSVNYEDGRDLGIFMQKLKIETDD